MSGECNYCGGEHAGDCESAAIDEWWELFSKAINWKGKWSGHALMFMVEDAAERAFSAGAKWRAMRDAELAEAHKTSTGTDDLALTNNAVCVEIIVEAIKKDAGITE